MIRLPAEAAGLHFEEDRETGQRLDQALRDAAPSPESLPLLEHVLSLLSSRTSGVITCSGGRIMRNSECSVVNKYAHDIQHVATA